MANQEHLEILKQGVQAWNEWRKQHTDERPDFTDADLSDFELEGIDLTDAILRRVNLRQAYLNDATLSGADLREADLCDVSMCITKLHRADLRRTALSGADLRGADLRGADLRGADLRGADLRGADLRGADIREAYLTESDLSGADLTQSDLSGANLAGANLEGADLSCASLVGADLRDAILTDCNIWGTSAWDVKLTGAVQKNLRITPASQSSITLDSLEVAQFIYLLLNNEKVRHVIDTITSKVVLILGRFTPERKAVLDAMADQLRSYNLLPIIFDFERAASRDFTETIKTLAGMSRFVIADITNPRSAPLELQATIPDYQIPFVPIIQEGESPFSMFADLTKYPWVLTLLRYQSPEGLIAVFKKAIIDRAFDKYKELLKLKARRVETIRVEEFLGESS